MATPTRPIRVCVGASRITLKRRVSEIEQRAKQTERKTDDREETVGDLADFNRAQVVPSGNHGTQRMTEDKRTGSGTDRGRLLSDLLGEN